MVMLLDLKTSIATSEEEIIWESTVIFVTLTSIICP